MKIHDKESGTMGLSVISDALVRLKSMKTKRNRQEGFTLIEIGIVVAAVGFLMAFLIPRMTGGGAKQEAMMLERVARAVEANYSVINRSCGTSTRIASNNILNSNNGAGVADMIFFGVFNESEYGRCYERSGVTPQSSDADQDTGNLSTPVRLTGTDIGMDFDDQTSPRAFTVIYTNVTSDVAEIAAQRFDTSAELGDTGNFPSTANDRAPLLIEGSGDDLTLTYRFLW